MTRAEARRQVVDCAVGAQVGAGALDDAAAPDHEGTVDARKLLNRLFETRVEHVPFILRNTAKRVYEQLLAVPPHVLVVAYDENRAGGFSFPTLLRELEGELKYACENEILDVATDSPVGYPEEVGELTLEIGEANRIERAAFRLAEYTHYALGSIEQTSGEEKQERSRIDGAVGSRLYRQLDDLVDEAVRAVEPALVGEQEDPAGVATPCLVELLRNMPAQEIE